MLIIDINTESCINTKDHPGSPVTHGSATSGNYGHSGRPGEVGGSGSSQIDTPEFKAWFGNSKVVDENDKPLRVFHGTWTAKDFKEFKPKVGAPFKGHYFTSSASLASSYTGQGLDGGHLIPCYLLIKNPATMQDYQTKSPDELIRLGYDGVISPSKGIFVVFESTQIKSATGNRGTFDPKDQNITNSNPNHDEQGRFSSGDGGESVHDGDKYFDPKQIASIGGYKSRDILIHMSPDDFLKMAEQTEGSDYKRATVAGVLASGKPFSDLPFLAFDHNDKGVAEVVSHEGRHRAMALKKLGVTSIPVVFQSRQSGNGQPIRWDQQGKKSYDRLQGEWPKVINGQPSWDDNYVKVPRGTQIKFPVTDLRK